MFKFSRVKKAQMMTADGIVVVNVTASTATGYFGSYNRKSFHFDAKNFLGWVR